MKLQNQSFLLNQMNEQHWHHLMLRRSTVLSWILGNLEEIGCILHVQLTLQGDPKTGWIVRALLAGNEVVLVIKYDSLMYLPPILRGIRGLM